MAEPFGWSYQANSRSWPAEIVGHGPSLALCPTYTCPGQPLVSTEIIIREPCDLGDLGGGVSGGSAGILPALGRPRRIKKARKAP